MIRRRGSWVWILFLVLGLYCINAPFKFVKIPAFLAPIEPWVIFICGIFLFVGGFNYLKIRRYAY
jgi:hypothetical protein